MPVKQMLGIYPPLTPTQKRVVMILGDGGWISQGRCWLYGPDGERISGKWFSVRTLVALIGPNKRLLEVYAGASDRYQLSAKGCEVYNILWRTETRRG